MRHSSLFGRRIHIAGSISEKLELATAEEVKRARTFIRELVQELIMKGATFVIPVDAEKLRTDDQPICFDWLVWKTIYEYLPNKPLDTPNPLVIAVKHHKTEDQIPRDYQDIWDKLRASDSIQIESAAYWNMNSKRMEIQASYGDILITLGGGEGVLFLANVYHDAGKPVIPLNFKLGDTNTGALRLYDFGISGANAQKLFQVKGLAKPQTYMNRIEMNRKKNSSDAVRDVLKLLGDLEPPKAFAVRLLNPKHNDYRDVQTFFDTVVQPIIEDELGYKLVVVDGKQSFDHARIDQEIFAKLHKSQLVLADITGLRPNCFLELGYALGRSLPIVLLAKLGTEHPFDIYSLSAHHWNPANLLQEQHREFIEHWNAIRNRPPLVSMTPLIP